MNFPSPSSADAVVTVTGLSRRFGPRRALEDVTLCVPRGCAFGLVGENGAGKTTLIKHLLGLLKPEAGSVRIFGLDPVADPVAVLRRVGYLSESRDLPGWMRVDELLWYARAYYPSWDGDYAEALRRQFGLNPEQKIRTLSQGQQARAALLLALAFRPDLLLLDEPSSGLDPVARRDILQAIIRTVAEEGRTVLFSSHLLEEVERVSDQIAMIRNGRIVLCGRLDEIKRSHHQIVLRFERPQPSPPSFPHALSWSGGGREWSFLCRGQLDRLCLDADRLGAEIVQETAPSLDEIFMALAVSGADGGWTDAAPGA